MYEFDVLEVQTLHIRDLTGEKRVQALGEFGKYAVCADCARERLEKTMDVRQSARTGIIRFGAVLLAGILLAGWFWRAGGPMRLLGLAAVLCGVLGIYAAVQGSLERRNHYAACSEEDALWQSAWEVMVDQAPKKSDDSDLTYIPVTSKTLSMKDGDIMIHYDLLPEIAVKAYEQIHKGF